MRVERLTPLQQYQRRIDGLVTQAAKEDDPKLREAVAYYALMRTLVVLGPSVAERQRVG